MKNNGPPSIPPQSNFGSGNSGTPPDPEDPMEKFKKVLREAVAQELAATNAKLAEMEVRANELKKELEEARKAAEGKDGSVEELAKKQEEILLQARKDAQDDAKKAAALLEAKQQEIRKNCSLIRHEAVSDNLSKFWGAITSLVLMAGMVWTAYLVKSDGPTGLLMLVPTVGLSWLCNRAQTHAEFEYRKANEHVEHSLHGHHWPRPDGLQSLQPSPRSLHQRNVPTRDNPSSTHSHERQNFCHWWESRRQKYKTPSNRGFIISFF